MDYNTAAAAAAAAAHDDDNDDKITLTSEKEQAKNYEHSKTYGEDVISTATTIDVNDGTTPKEDANDGHNDDNKEKNSNNDKDDDDEDDEDWRDADFLSFSTDNNDDKPENNNNPSSTTTTTTITTPDNNNNDNNTFSSTTTTPPINTTPQPQKPRTAIDIVSSQTSQIAPWMMLSPSSSSSNYLRYCPGLIKLHNEIIDFAKLVMPWDCEIKERDELVEVIRVLAEETFGGKDKCKVVVFGSHATRTFLPVSDIDLVVQLDNNNKTTSTAATTSTEDKSNNKTSKSNPIVIDDETKDDPIVINDDNDSDDDPATAAAEMAQWKPNSSSSTSSHNNNNNYYSNKSPLIRLADAIRDAWKDDVTYLEVVENTRVPIVKLTHGPTNTSVDICFDQSGGPECAEIMNGFLEDFPPLRALCFVLKYFTKIRGINEPYHGGIGSFTLQMLIVSFLQHRGREEYNTRGQSLSTNLGGLLLEFFELYGLDFNYITTGISVRNDGSYFPKGSKNRREYFWQPSRPFSLAIENPFDPTCDVGRSTYRMGRIQRSFDVAFRMLLAHVTDGESGGGVGGGVGFGGDNGDGGAGRPLEIKSVLACIIPPTDELKKRAALIRAGLVPTGLNNDEASTTTKNQLRDERWRGAGRTDAYNNNNRLSLSSKRGSVNESDTGSDMVTSDDDDDDDDDDQYHHRSSKRRRRGSGGSSSRSGSSNDDYKRRGRGYNNHGRGR